MGEQKKRVENWLRGRDLNPRPSGYEPDELPGCSTPRSKDGQYTGFQLGGKRFLQKTFSPILERIAPPARLRPQQQSSMKQPRRIQVSFREEPGWTVPVQKSERHLLPNRERLRPPKLRLPNTDSPPLTRFRSAA